MVTLQWLPQTMKFVSSRDRTTIVTEGDPGKWPKRGEESNSGGKAGSEATSLSMASLTIKEIKILHCSNCYVFFKATLITLF